MKRSLFAPLVALAMVSIGACDQPPSTSEAVVPAPTPRVLEQVTPSAKSGYAIQLQSGHWCTGETGETYLTGNEKFCTRMKDLRFDPALGAPLRRLTMKASYHQPGPKTAKGDVAGWSETDARFNCETGEMLVIVAVTYGVDGTELLAQTSDKNGRTSVTASPAMRKAFCDPLL